MKTDQQEILVVDDDGLFRTLVSSLLQRAGYDTAEAATGEEALTSVRRNPPDCILLDVLLPGASGYEVCHELKDEYGEALPIIFLTGERTEPADRVAGLLIGADDYMLKPFDPDELIARVRRHVARVGRFARPNGYGRNGFRLTAREREVLSLLAGGLEQETIASELFISPKTVASHIQRILSKLGVHSRAQAVAVAHQHGLAAMDD